MADRKKIQKVLNKSLPTLRPGLDLNEDFLIKLKATEPEVITDDEHDTIKTKAPTARVDYLVDLLKRRSKNVFFMFMEVLQEKDPELYDAVNFFYEEQFPVTEGKAR